MKPALLSPTPVERLFRRPALARSCVLAWSSMWGNHARLGPRFGGGQIPLSVSTPAKYIYDETQNPPIIRAYPANLLPWSAPQEPARTNAIVYSLDFSQANWTKRGTAAYSAGQADPLGGTGATRLTINSGLNDIYQVVVYAAGSKLLATSVWIKRVSSSGVIKIANPGDSALGLWEVNLAALPDRWVRLSASSPYVTVTSAFTSTGSLAGGIHFTKTPAGVVSFDIWNPQQEYDSAYPTSDIPTGSSAVSRAADAVRLINAGLFGPLANEGSLLCVFRAPYTVAALSADQGIVSINGSDSLNNCHRIIIESGAPAGAISFSSLSGGSGQGQIPSSGGTTLAAGTLYAVAITFKANNLALYVNGSLIGTDPSATPPVGLDRLEIGSDRSSNARFGGDTFLVAAFDRALQDHEAREATMNPRDYIKAS